MRLMMKRPLADLWLDLDAPATDITVTQSLNAPGDITCSLPIQYLSRKAEDGEPVLQEFNTLLIVEHDDESLDVALVDNISLEGTTLTVSGGGLSMISKDIPWLGPDKKYTLADPVVIFKEIWNHIQSYPEGNVGLALTGDTKSTGTLGVPSTQAYRTASTNYLNLVNEVSRSERVLKEREATLTETTAKVFKAVGLHTVGQIKIQKTAPTAAKNVVWVDSDDYNKAYIYTGGKWVLKSGAQPQVSVYLQHKAERDNTKNWLADRRKDRTAAKEALDKVAEGKGEPYEINWYSTHDLAQTIDELTEAGPFEFVERSKWVGDNIALSLEVGAPLIGARKEDLVFELGVNVVSQPTLNTHDPYTEVFQLGAGEGSATLKATRVLSNAKRVRRVYVETDKDARTQQVTNKAADRSLKKVSPRAGFTFETMTVIDHSFARPSQYGVGDEIHVTGILPDDSELDVWVRIKEITRTAGDSTIDLKVQVV